MPICIVAPSGISSAMYSAMAYARAGIITSGSATLEALISKLPSVVLYRVDPLTWAVGKNLIKTPHIALANLVAGERIFPEFIQKINSEKLCGEVRRILFDEQMREDMKNKMSAAIRN
ncbi:MAG TPA: hypothetical protein EYP52_04300, partial [Anaerolineae bacterium]|nr:hypothetical protein [Anaerolineae bacterium]